MATLIFNKEGAPTGASEVAPNCPVATYGYQVIGDIGAKVSFYGTNKPRPDKAALADWQHIVSITHDGEENTAVLEHPWSNLMYMVEQGNADIYVSVGVAG